MTRFYNTKVIISSITEIYEYGEPIAYGFKKPENEKQCRYKRTSFQDATVDEKQIRIERMKKHYLNERWTIARLIDVNFDNHTSFMTLTFRENIQDISVTNYEFKKFIKRLNYFMNKKKKAQLKYLAVWELQKRGAIHYHVMLFNVPKIPHKDLVNIWGNGAVNIQKVDADSKDNRGRYLSKYFAKNLDNLASLIKFLNKKRFFRSKNLKEPDVKFFYHEKPMNFSNDKVLYQKEFMRKQKMGEDWIETPVRYTKVKPRKV